MNTTVSQSAASGGMTGAAMIVAAWALAQFHVTVPAEVALAAMSLLAPVAHYAVVLLTKELPKP